MKFTIYNDPQDFFDLTWPLLMPKELENNLMFKNIESALAAGNPSEYLLAAITDDAGAVWAAVTKSPGFAAVVGSTQNAGDSDVVLAVARGLAGGNVEFVQIKADRKYALAYAKAYGGITSKSYALTEELILYSLDTVSPVREPVGIFRGVCEKDMSFLPYWCADFTPTVGVGDYILDNGIKIARRLINNGVGYVWEVNGAAVSLAAVTRSVGRYSILGQVYTPPFYQGQGYSTACVANVARLLLDRQRVPALYADARYPVSNRVYEKVGFKPLAGLDTYTFN